MDREEPIPIHYETIELGPHRRKIFILPKAPPFEDKKNIWIWVVAALIVGVSVPYFLLDVTNRVAGLIRGETKENLVAEITPTEENSEADGELLSAADEISLGSDNENNLIIKNDENASTTTDGTYFFLKENHKLPRTSGLAYLVGDVETGEILIQKNPEMVFPIASISKLITALVSVELLDLHKVITVTRSSVLTYGQSGGLYAGEKILVTDLLYPLLIESSNDAAEVLAEGFGRIDFMKRMNSLARELGMTSSFFHDPSGLSPKNVSNSKDLFTLIKYIYKSKPELLDITRVKEYAILKHKWVNGSALMQKPSFIGGKNGYTEEAFRTTVSVFDVVISKNKRKVAVVVLKSNDRNGDANTLIRFVETNMGFIEKDSPLLKK